MTEFTDHFVCFIECIKMMFCCCLCREKSGGGNADGPILDTKHPMRFSTIHEEEFEV